MAKQPTKARESLSSANALLKPFKAARNRGTPLLAIQTPDQFATMARLVAEVNHDTPFLSWDVVRGFVGLNDRGTAAITKLCPNGGEEAAGMLMLGCKMAAKLDANCVLFVLNAQRHVDDAMNAQAVCNLRDQFKVNGRTLVLLGPQVTLPAELQPDFVVLDEPLPGRDELLAIIRRLHADNEQELTVEVGALAVDAVQGLPAFAAEQVTAMSMAKEGLDVEALWERKRRQIEQTPGLSVSREGIKFDDLGGLQAIKDYLAALIGGQSKPNAVVWVDEIEKLLAGAGGDTSGVTQDQLGTLLSYMQDTRAIGVLLVGIPGSGKSAIAKATGNQAGIPTVRLDLGACKNSLVGQSEHQLRAALKVITSVSNGSTIWMATCNSLAALPPELRRRFRAGLFYFDLPTDDERERIWDVHRAKHGIKASEQNPQDDGWTGAEIEQACDLAYRLGKPLRHAAQFVVPISQSAPDRVEQLRQQADGRWLSASHAGVYRKDRDAAPVAGKRKLNMDE